MPVGSVIDQVAGAGDAAEAGGAGEDAEASQVVGSEEEKKPSPIVSVGKRLGRASPCPFAKEMKHGLP